MTIDLSQWNEYIAEDAESGPIPLDVKLETMQIVSADSWKEQQKDSVYLFPAGLKADPDSVKIRLFWRIKE